MQYQEAFYLPNHHYFETVVALVEAVPYSLTVLYFQMAKYAAKIYSNVAGPEAVWLAFVLTRTEAAAKRQGVEFLQDKALCFTYLVLHP